MTAVSDPPVRDDDRGAGPAVMNGIPVSVWMVGGAAVMVVLALLPEPLRALNLPVMLLLPGFALVTALLGAFRPSSLLARVISWLAASLASLAVVSTIVSLPDLELTRGRVLAGQVLVILGCAALAWLSPASNGEPTSTEPERRLVGQALAAMVVGVGLAVAAVAFGLATSEDPTVFIRMSLSDPEASAPLAHPGDGSTSVEVVVRNDDDQVRRFELVPAVEGVGGVAWDRVTFELPPGQEWVGEVAGPVPASGCLQRVGVKLRVDDADSNVNRLTRWVAGQDGVPCEPRNPVEAPPTTATAAADAPTSTVPADA